MNNREISLFLMLTSLLSMITIGYSIRQYIDTMDYLKLGISLVLVIIIIAFARSFTKIAFARNVIIQK